MDNIAYNCYYNDKNQYVVELKIVFKKYDITKLYDNRSGETIDVENIMEKIKTVVGELTPNNGEEEDPITNIESKIDKLLDLVNTNNTINQKLDKMMTVDEKYTKLLSSNEELKKIITQLETVINNNINQTKPVFESLNKIITTNKKEEEDDNAK